MSVSSIFQIILAQQAAEARKEERQQDLALNLLSMDIRREELEMNREVTLLDRQIARNEKRYDTVLDEFQTTKDEYQEATGLIYKLPEVERKDGSIDVLKDIKGGDANSLNDLLLDIKRDTQNMQTAKGDMERQIYKSGLISDFYKGYGHDMSKGDPERWDAPDFGEEALTEYMAQYPELEGVDKQAFYEGVKTREEASLFENIQALNVVIDQAKTAELSAATKQLEYDTKVGNIDASQLEADIDNIDSGVHSMMSKQATSLNTGILSPAMSATSIYAEAQETGSASDISTAKELQEEELIKVGTLISGIEAQDESMLAENLRLGMLFVSGNANYVNSIPGYLKESGELNYGGWVDALQEIEMYSEYYKSQLESGTITPQQYLGYKNNIEELIGDDLNNFSEKLGVLITASESVENKGQLLALKGMQDTMTEVQITPTDTTRTDFNIDPNNYIVPKDTIDVAEAERLAMIKAGMTGVIDDPALKSLETIELLAMTKAGMVDDLASLPSDTILNKQQKVTELTDRLDVLKKAGFQGTEEYEDISNNVKALTREIKEAQRLEDYMAEMEIKLAEGKVSDEEIAKISAATGVSEKSLKDYLKQGRTEKVLEVISNIPGTPQIRRRAAYERSLQK